MYRNNISNIGDNCAGHYQLAENITVSTSEGFPLCNNPDQPFNGSLKSGAFLISGLNVNNPGGNAGMFGYMSGARVDVHLVNPVARGENAGAVAAHMLSDNQVNATFSGGDIEGRGAAGGMAAQVNGDRNRLQQTGGNMDTLMIRASGTVADAGGGIGQQAGANNTLIQNQLRLNVAAGRYAGGGFGTVSDSQNTTLSQREGQVDVIAQGDAGGGAGEVINSQDAVLSQIRERISVGAVGNVGGGIGLLDQSDRTTLSQYEGQMDVTAYGIQSSAGGGGGVGNSQNTTLSQRYGQVNVTAFTRAGGGVENANDTTLSQDGVKMNVLVQFGDAGGGGAVIRKSQRTILSQSEG